MERYSGIDIEIGGTEILDKVQNHSQNDVSSKHYVRWGFIDEKHEAMVRWNEILKEILSCVQMTYQRR